LEEYTAYDFLVAMTYNMYIAKQQIDSFLYYWTIALKDKSRDTATSLSVPYQILAYKLLVPGHYDCNSCMYK
jgi:hypothetical protein